MPLGRGAAREGGRIRLEPGDRLRSCPSRATLRREGSGNAARASLRRPYRTRPFLRGRTGFLLADGTNTIARRGTAGSSRGLILCAALVLGACAGERSPAPDAHVSVIDDAGRTVALAAPARRVVSLIPAQTEVVATLAGVDALVARTQWDRDPRLAHLPSLGNALTPSAEWLAAQRADLIIAWPDAQSRDLVQRLTDIGLPVYASSVESVADIRSMILRLGTLLGVSVRADSLVAAVDAELDAVRARVAGLPQRTVLYLLSAEPPLVAGPGTFMHELIGIAGGGNVFGDLRQLWPQVSLEEIVRRQPDVIIRPSEDPSRDPLADLAARSGWRDLRAVREGRVYRVDAYLFNRAGITIGEAGRQLAELIHPEAPQ